MKKITLISAMCLMSLSNYAQQIDKNQYFNNEKDICLKDPNMPAGAKLTWPASEYVSAMDPSCPPCYTYTSKYGTDIMECPFVTFFPKQESRVAADNTVHPAEDNMVNGMNVIAERSYTGEYPKSCKLDPHMPANAKPSWPESAYVSLVAPQCAPCYTYTNKNGLVIMECPGLIFLPENKK